MHSPAGDSDRGQVRRDADPDIECVEQLRIVRRGSAGAEETGHGDGDELDLLDLAAPYRRILRAKGAGCRRAEALSTLLQGCRRSEEHTSELQSQSNLVCRLLLE